jgi:hypothetical protein
MVPRELLTAPQVSIQLGLPVERLRRMLQARRLGSIVGGRYLVPRDAVEILRAELAKRDQVTA